ncbi:MAG TPA: hypothetical protein GXZ89_06165 [Fastidiosipila sp.]|nr:hypothetical protein [Fastidiosipila sp.]
MSQEITLDTLANRNNSPVDEHASYHTVDVDYAPDPQVIADKAANIDLLSSENIASYGEQSYRDVLAYGQRLLAHVRTNAFAGIDQKLAQLANVVKHLNVEQMNDGGVLGRIPFLKSLSGGIRAFEKRFGQALEQSAQAEAELNELAVALREDKAVYDELLSAKRPLVAQLAVDIEAGRQTLENVQGGSLPQLEAEAEMSDDGQAKHLVSNYRRRVTGFNSQVDDLDNTQNVFSEIGPRIVSIQANNLQLADKISQITGKIIPYWKSQIALAVSMVKEQELLKQKREEMKRMQKQHGGEDYGAATHAEDLQLVDLEAVKKINNNLLGTIDDAAMLQRAGQAVRLDTEATLLRLDGRIRQAMISAAAFGDDLQPEPVISEKRTDLEADLETEEAFAGDDALFEDDDVARLDDQKAEPDVDWDVKETEEDDASQLPLPDSEQSNPQEGSKTPPQYGTYDYKPRQGDYDKVFAGSIDFDKEKRGDGASVEELEHGPQAVESLHGTIESTIPGGHKLDYDPGEYTQLDGERHQDDWHPDEETAQGDTGGGFEVKPEEEPTPHDHETGGGEAPPPEWQDHESDHQPN